MSSSSSPDDPSCDDSLPESLPCRRRSSRYHPLLGCEVNLVEFDKDDSFLASLIDISYDGIAVMSESDFLIGSLFFAHFKCIEYEIQAFSAPFRVVSYSHISGHMKKLGCAPLLDHKNYDAVGYRRMVRSLTGQI